MTHRHRLSWFVWVSRGQNWRTTNMVPYQRTIYNFPKSLAFFSLSKRKEKLIAIPVSSTQENTILWLKAKLLGHTSNKDLCSYLWVFGGARRGQVHITHFFIQHDTGIRPWWNHSIDQTSWLSLVPNSTPTKLPRNWCKQNGV